MNKLKELRISKGLTQSELAKAAEMSKRTLQHYEQGWRDLGCANLDTILSICMALGCKLGEILESESLKKKLLSVEHGEH